MNLDRYDSVVKSRCEELPLGIQVRSGYKNKKQVRKAVSIYKDSIKQEEYGAGRAYAQIAEQDIEGILLHSKRFLPIRYVNLDKGTDAPIRPVANPINPTEPIDPVQELVANISRQQSLSQELQEVAAELSAKADRGEAPDPEELTYVERLERQLEKAERDNKELRFLVEKGKVQERTLAQMEMDALEEAGRAEESAEAQRKLNALMTASKPELVDYLEANKEIIVELNAGVPDGKREPFSRIKTMSRERILKYLLDYLNIDVEDLYIGMGMDLILEAGAAGAGPSRLQEEGEELTFEEQEFEEEVREEEGAGQAEDLPARETTRRMGVREIQTGANPNAPSWATSNYERGVSREEGRSDFDRP